jgi:Competence protein CoiA-like family
MHRPGAGNHAPETLFHQQAKALLVRWIRQVTLDVVACVEGPTPSGARRADVMLQWPDGHRVAIEIQYSPLSVQSWRERHASYQQQGIVDVWLFGHLPPHLRPVPPPAHGVAHEPQEQVELSSLLRAVVDAGLPVLWLNPSLEMVGTTWIDTRPREYPLAGPDQWQDLRLPVRPRPHMRSSIVTFESHRLDRCILIREGIVPPRNAELTENERRLQAIEADRHARHLEATAAAEQQEQRRRAVEHDQAEKRQERARQEKKAEQQRREAAERTQREAAARREYQARWRSHLPQWREEWLCNPFRVDIVRGYGRVPAIIRQWAEPTEGVWSDPEYWHAVLHEHLLARHPPGTVLAMPEVYDVLVRHHIRVDQNHPNLVYRTLMSYIAKLEAAGHVRRSRNPDRSELTQILVCGPVENLTAAEKRRARERATLQNQRDGQQRSQKEQGRLLPQEQIRWDDQVDRMRPQAASHLMGSRRTALRTSAATRPLRCSICHQPLSPVLAQLGHHVLC